MEDFVTGQGFILFITLFAMVIGLILTVIPPIPGPLVIWGAALAYGLILGWEQLGTVTFLILSFLMLAGVILDVVAGHVGASIGGASCLAIFVGAVIGIMLGIVATFIGTPILGCLAGLIGMIAGVFMIEYSRNQDWETTVRAIQGYLVGSAAGIAIRVLSAVAMIGVFLGQVYIWG